jgi:hypothetical protein
MKCPELQPAAWEETAARFSRDLSNPPMTPDITMLLQVRGSPVYSCDAGDHGPCAELQFR